MNINQAHYGSGDNIAGNKIVVNKQPDRSIGAIKNKLLDEIKQYPQNYKIFLSSGDSEMDSFAREIDQVFTEAGWRKNGFIYKLAGFFPPGITFEVKEVDKISQFIANVFHSAGFKVRGNLTPTAEQFNIIIGPNN